MVTESDNPGVAATVSALRFSAIAFALWGFLWIGAMWLRSPGMLDADWGRDLSRSVENLAPAPLGYDLMPSSFWIFGVPLGVTFSVLAFRRVAKAMKRRLG